MIHISCNKLFLFWRYLNFCYHFFGLVGKRFDNKAKINFKSYDVAVWETNNYNTHIAKYHKKEKQSDNKIWSVNKV